MHNRILHFYIARSYELKSLAHNQREVEIDRGQ